MSSELSSSTRALLRTARNDAPNALARAKILGGIGAATSGATAVGVGAAAKAAGGTKLMLAGALFGSAVTVGVAALVLGIGSPKAPLAPEPSFAMHADPEVAPVAPAMRAPSEPEPEASHLNAAPVRHVAARAHAAGAGAPEDTLARETELVAEARGALVRGQPDTALGALRATDLLPSRALEPEELSLQARALRALGRNPEADFVERQLRARFPDNALSR